MKKLLIIMVLFSFYTTHAQNSPHGSIVGKLTDREMNGEPLPFANVQIKGTTKGTTTDYDGIYALNSLEPGIYTLVFSFIGYEALEIPNVEVKANITTTVDAELGASAAALDEVIISTVSRRDSEVALLLEQKAAIEIKESIGAPQLQKMGVSDAATATTKISGVTSSETSGNIFVRGLGDRYLFSTMNGLSIPSDDVRRKNIDLELFSTRVLQSVNISKTFSPQYSADQASGTINISSRELNGPKELAIGIQSGINTNAVDVGDDFRLSANASDISLGFHSKDMTTQQAITQQTWNTQEANFPINSRFSVVAGKRFGEKLEVLFSGSQSTSYRYRPGVFREFRNNFIQDSLTDVEEFSKTVSTTGLVNIGYQINPENKLRAVSLFINKLQDEVLEGGRNQEGAYFEETEPVEGLSQFIRDQNTVQTRLWVNQLLGEHQITSRNQLNWAIGVNTVSADEPNRIRNQVNFNDDFIQLGRTGGFQQRKSAQLIDDEEFTALLKDKISITDTEKFKLDATVGGNYRHKERNFFSQFVGAEEIATNTLNPASIDNLSEVFTPENLDEGLLKLNILQPDRYIGNLTSAAGFASLNFKFEKLNINVGGRFQSDELDVKWNVGNYPGRTGETNLSSSKIYPSLNASFAINEKHNIRLASSQTVTLPEFKEMAPFEYVSQTGQVERGNPNVQTSTNYNLDLKWEFFPSAEQLISLTGFFKRIEDPINRIQERGSAGRFSFYNSGEKAEIYGLEAETRIELLSSTNSGNIDLDINLNATRMWHSQDLKQSYNDDGAIATTFRYKGLTETGLEGASDWILNTAINMSLNSDNTFLASVIANYASDKIFALGSPEIQDERSEIFYNDAIIEQGFVSLDAVISKNFGEHWNLRLVGKNLLNPEIKRTQNIRPSTTGIETTEVVRSYTRGADLRLGVSYRF